MSFQFVGGLVGMGFGYIVTAPFLPSCCGFFVFGCRLSFWKGSSLFVDGCSAVGCDSGVFIERRWAQVLLLCYLVFASPDVFKRMLLYLYLRRIHYVIFSFNELAFSLHWALIAYFSGVRINVIKPPYPLWISIQLWIFLNEIICGTNTSCMKIYLLMPFSFIPPSLKSWQNTYILEKMGLKQKIQREATAVLFCKHVASGIHLHR